MPLPVTEAHVREAHARIAPHVRRTPTWHLAQGAAGYAGPVSLKFEFMQHAGSFKTRGAFNTLLSQAQRPASVTAASGGNHGAGVAYAARTLGLPAKIFVPEISSPAKIAIIQSYGADIVIGGARYADAQEACDRYVAQTGALRVHPFDTPETIAGQGTVALEWAEDAALDTVLVAAGGGGLLAGIAAFFGDRIRVVGVEPQGSRAVHAALEAGHPVDVPVHSIAADSLGARAAGPLAYEIIKQAAPTVVLVTDAAITQAQRTLWSNFRIAAEPGGSAAFAALESRAYPPTPNERVGILLCGANVDLTTLTS